MSSSHSYPTMTSHPPQPTRYYYVNLYPDAYSSLTLEMRRLVDTKRRKAWELLFHSFVRRCDEFRIIVAPATKGATPSFGRLEAFLGSPFPVPDFAEWAFARRGILTPDTVKLLFEQPYDLDAGNITSFFDFRMYKNHVERFTIEDYDKVLVVLNDDEKSELESLLLQSDVFFKLVLIDRS